MKKITMTVLSDEDYADDAAFFEKFFEEPEKFKIDVHVEKEEGK